MKNLLILTTLLFTFTCSAIQLTQLKKGNSLTDYSEAEVSKAWASTTTAACIKDGSKLIGVNATFAKKNLRYADCSSSALAAKKQEKTGVKVVVFKYALLPKSIIASFNK